MEQNNKKDAVRQYGIVTSFIYEMIVFIVLMTLLGVFLDDLLNTKALFTIVLILLGMAAAFRNLYKRMIKKGDSNETK